MSWAVLYVVAIAVGGGLLAVSFALGWLHAVGSTFHVSGHHSSVPDQLADSPLQLGLLAPFCIWFGVAGYFLTCRVEWPWFPVLLVACAAGVLGAAIPRSFVRRVLARHDHRLPRRASLWGALAIVTQTVRPGGTGEIALVGEGRRCLVARSTARRTLTRGTEVVVVDYADGVAEVARLDDDGSDRAVQRPLAPTNRKGS
jgi:membrane protein implicated in regulation of membrane protease activity